MSSMSQGRSVSDSCSASGNKQRPARPVVPEDARSHDGSTVARQVGPTIVVDIGLSLSIHARQERMPPPLIRFVGQPQHRVRTTQGGLVEKQLALIFRPARNEVDHAPEGGGPIECRSRALDDFDLREVHWRDLERP